MNRTQKIKLDIYEHGSTPAGSEHDVAAAWIMVVIVILSLVLTS